MKKFRKAKKESGRSALAGVIELPPIVTECTTWLTQHGAQRNRPYRCRHLTVCWV
jgi:hypothetical protein